MRALIFILLSLNAGAQCIPAPGKVSVYLDGTVGKMNGSWYFIDYSGNSRHFLINNIDFDTTNINKGFPYRSLATISAPIDAVLMANDDSMFYKNGVPVPISVTDLFQNINYSNKIFTKHQDRQVDTTGKEIYYPRVKELVWYSNLSNEIAECNSYFNVPVEDTEAVWLSEQGNNSNYGNKAYPKRSIDGIKATIKPTVYIRSGSYDCGITLSTLTGNALLIQGTGKCIITTATTSNGLVNQRPLVIANCEIKDTATSTGISSTNNIELNRCKIRTTRGSYTLVGNGVAGKIFTLKDCIIPVNWTGTSLCRNQSGLSYWNIIGCYGKIYNSFGTNSITSLSIKYNRGLSGSYGLYYTKKVDWKDNWNIGTFTAATINKSTFYKENINSTLNMGGADSLFIDKCNITGNINARLYALINSTVNGSVILDCANNLLVKGNNITAPLNTIGLRINGTTGLNLTGVVVDSNIITGNISISSYIFYIGAYAEGGSTSIQSYQVTRNKISNLSTVGVGGAHTAFLGGGLNGKFWYNDVTCNNGSALVFKTTGGHYTDTLPSAAYNVFHFTGTPSYGILSKGTYGVIVANNTLLNLKAGVSAFESNDGGYGQDNSMLAINNVVTLAGNVQNFNVGTNLTGRYNIIKSNGYTYGLKGATDSLTTVVVDANGTPISRLDYGEVTGNCIGLDENYLIPAPINYRQQDNIWQCGAVLKANETNYTIK